MQKFFMPTHVKFGEGALSSLTELVGKENRVFFVTDNGLEALGMGDRVRDLLKQTGAEFTTFHDVDPNPTAELVNRVRKLTDDFQPTMIVALGGGSPTDLGKILAALATNRQPLEDYQWNGVPFANDPIPFIAIPTTSGTGSEVTGCAVIVDRNQKRGIDSGKLFPKYAIVDPTLMVGLPVYLTATTGVDALTHAIEAYTGLGASAFTDALAEEAIRLIGKYLWRACAYGPDLEARYQMALASSLAGIAMDQGGLGMVHAMSSPLCTYFHMAHGEANAILLEHVMSYNLMARPEKFAKIAELLGCETEGLDTYEKAELSVEAVHRLFANTGARVDLKKTGIHKSDADLIAEETLNMFLLLNNPRKPSKEDCRNVILQVMDAYGVE